jgi:hypothetical protein
MKTNNLYRALLVSFLALALLFASLPGQAEAMMAQSINVGASAVRQGIVYKEPVVNGVEMPDSGVVSNFEMLIYARGRMLSHLQDYKQLGWSGLSLLYMDMSKNNGPAGLASVAAQKILCTPSQAQTEVYTNTITMDTGELCRIHDAIINKTQVDGFTVSEDWFLHRADGSRYESSGGGTSDSVSQYRMNFTNPEYQKYYINKLRREFRSVDSAHLPTGAQGLFFDNINLSWPDLIDLNGGNPPVEFADKPAYQQGMVSFLSAVRAEFPEIQIWGNMTSFSTNISNFTDFKPYLDGAMIEGAFLDWHGDPRPADEVEKANLVADTWGKPLLYVVQGDTSASHHLYAFGLYLLMTNPDAYFFYTDQHSYANYYSLAEYKLALGEPTGARQLLAAGVWNRQFQNGSVQVDMNTQEVKISMIPRQVLANPGFESYSGVSKIPLGWSATRFGSVDGKDLTVKKEGRASVKIRGAASVIKTLSQVVNVGGIGGEALSFSFFVKGSSIPAAGLCRAQIFLYDGATLVQVQTINCPTGTFVFRKLALNFTAPADFTKVQVKFTYAKSKGTVWFDGLSLVK